MGVWDPKLQLIAHVTAQETRVEPGPGESDMTVGTQEIERGSRDVCARELPVIGRIARDLVDTQQVTELRYAARRRGLPDHDQIESRVVESCEQVFSGTVRRDLEPYPG